MRTMDAALGQSLVEALGTILAALLAAVGAVLTWFLTTRDERRRSYERRLHEAELARAEREQARTDEIAARAQRVSDIASAIHAEISATMRGVVLQTQPAEAQYFIDNADPFVVADETDFVFTSIADDLSILPEAVIHEVVAYYKIAKQTNLLTAAMERPGFRGQSPEEKRKYVRGLLELTVLQRNRGEEALAKLEAFKPALAAKRRYALSMAGRAGDGGEEGP